MSSKCGLGSSVTLCAVWYRCCPLAIRKAFRIDAVENR